MKRSFKRLILKEISDQNQSYEDQLHDLAWKNDWLLWGQKEADHENQIPFELTWITSDEETGIHYIEDYVVGFPYLVIDGKDLEETVYSIQSSFDVYSTEEILQWVETAANPEEQAKAVFHLGVVAPQEFDSRFFDVFQRVFLNPNPEVRMAAIKASAYMGWREFREILEHLKSTDPDEKVRAKADVMLQAFDSQDIT